MQKNQNYCSYTKYNKKKKRVYFYVECRKPETKKMYLQLTLKFGGGDTKKQFWVRVGNTQTYTKIKI